MSIQIRSEDRDVLRRYVERPWKLTTRQKALALLGLAEGESPEAVSARVGIKKADIAELIARFSERGLAGIGLRSGRASKSPKQAARYRTIEKTPGVCGGAARIRGTRVPVWLLVDARNQGASEVELLTDFPALNALNLVEAWAYALECPDEIQVAIVRNQEA